MDRMAWLHLVIIGTVYVLVVIVGNPYLSFPAMLGSIGFVFWATRNEDMWSLPRVLTVVSVAGIAVMLFGKDPLLGIYLAAYGASPYLWRVVTTRARGR